MNYIRKILVENLSKENLEEIKKLLSINLTFLRVLKSYCTDETVMNQEIKDILVALDDILPRQEMGINKLSEMIESLSC